MRIEGPRTEFEIKYQLPAPSVCVDQDSITKDAQDYTTWRSQLCDGSVKFELRVNCSQSFVGEFIRYHRFEGRWIEKKVAAIGMPVREARYVCGK